MSTSLPRAVSVLATPDDRPPYAAHALTRRFAALLDSLCPPRWKTEDYVVQSMPEASPAKWHLAHKRAGFLRPWCWPRPQAQPLANPSGQATRISSIRTINALGADRARRDRGLLVRPTVAEVYRVSGGDRRRNAS